LAKQPTLSVQRTSMLNFINGTGKIFKKVGINPFKLDADAIIIKAKKKAGYNKQLIQAETGLRELIHSINTEANTNPFGSLAIKGLLERTLYGRYKIEQTLAENPEIELSEIEQPVFIIGMPRTGTTILHALIYEDPVHRAPLAWECLLPYPPPTPENFRDNDQLKTVTKEFGQLFKLVPDFLRKHYMAADSPQECLGINAFDFNSFQMSAQAYIPTYMDWFAHEADRLQTMRFHKRFLQFLQSGGVKGERWLLKSPVHLMRLPELFEVYPDARIIMTHRHPNKIVASTASLMSSVRSLYSDSEDPVRTGHEQAEIWSLYFKRFMESRQKLNKEDQIIDLKFDDFAEDQMSVVQQIYTRFGWSLSGEAVRNFKQFLVENPREKNGLHGYTLEKFGLTENGIKEQFGSYIDFLDQL